MRTRIIDFLNNLFRHDVGRWIVPEPVFVYAVMLGLGVVLYIRRCKSDKLNLRHATGIAIWAIVGALLGARIFYLIQHAEYTFQHPETLLETNGATVSFGVYIGGAAGMFAYASLYKIILWNYADTLTSVLGIGPMIGRMACFLNGDDYGRLSNLPWAVRYPHGTYPFLAQVASGLIDPMNDLSLSVHPVQLYGIVKGVILFVVFTYLWKKKKFKPGVLFFLFWICYSVLRFVLEFFRGDEDRGWVGPLSIGQFMSIIIFTLSLLSILLLIKRPEKLIVAGEVSI